MDSLLRDLRFAFRTLRRSPLFVGVAAMTLAFGLGVNATIFTFVNAVLLRPRPVERPAELASIYTSWPEEAYGTSSYADYLDLRQGGSEVFADLFGHSMAIASLQEGGRSEMVVGELVTGSAFESLGLSPALGRLLQPADDASVGAPRVAVLGHGLWQRRFASDPAVVGRTLRLNGHPYEVVGVAPESFPGMMPGVASSFFAPAVRVDEIDAAGQINAESGDPGQTLLERRGYRWLWLEGRLRPGVTPAQAETAMRARMGAVAEAYPATNKGKLARVLPSESVRIHPEVDQVLGPVAAVLLGAVSLVLLIVCANLATMLLARAEGRSREIAVRLAIGASRGQLVRQLLVESLVLATAGAGLALALAHWTSRLLLAYRPPLPVALDLAIGVDARVVGFTVLLALATAVVFGLVPALQASRPDLVPSLKQGVRSGDGGGRFFSLRGALVTAQVAVSLVLLVAAALLLRGLSKAQSIDVGIDADRVAAVPLALSMNGYDEARAEAFFRTLRERAAALPGVEAAALATRVPFDVNLHQNSVFPDSMSFGPDDAGVTVDVTAVDPEYFAAVGVALRQGRLFDGSERPETPHVAVVNQAAARRFWGDEPAVGRTLRLGKADGRAVEVVGVVADHKVRTVGEEPRPLVHFALAQRGATYAYLLARATGDDATALAETLRRTALELDPELAFTEIGTLGRLMAVTLYPVRMGAFLLGSFGLLALVLASVGLYGVIATAVARRRRELGVRLALGAKPAEILALVLRGGFGLVAAGAVAGLLLAAAGTRFLSGVLYGTSALDPLAFGAAVAVLGLVALAANLVPAARASRLDPVIVLREE